MMIKYLWNAQEQWPELPGRPGTSVCMPTSAIIDRKSDLSEGSSVLKTELIFTATDNWAVPFIKQVALGSNFINTEITGDN